MRNIQINTFIRILSTVLIGILFLPYQSTACDTTPTLNAGNIKYAGDGLYTIEIAACIGDAGSTDGFSIDVDDVNIIGFAPTEIENILNSKIANGSFQNNMVDYKYIGAGNFVDAGQNSCFWTTLTVDAFPGESNITIDGVNAAGGCAVLDSGSNGDNGIIGVGVIQIPIVRYPACGETFYDTGGPTGNYGFNENYTVVICGGGGPVTLEFTEFALSPDGDVMSIFDNDDNVGPSTSYNYGSAPPMTISSTNPSNCLTIDFESSLEGFGPGWAAEVVCPAPCPNDLNVKAMSTDATCFNTSDGEAATEVSGGVLPYSFKWNTGAIGHKLESINTGMYIVTVTDGNGCTAIDTASLSVISSIDLETNGTAVDCNNDDGEASVAVLGGGVPPYGYLWNTGDQSKTVMGLGVGEYIITVTDSEGCAGTAAITLVNDTDLDVQVTVSNQASCYGYNDGQATANVSGGVGNYNFQWHTGETTHTATQLEAGRHAVTITDDENCMVVDSFTVEQPPLLTAMTGSNRVSCFGGDDGVAWVIPEAGSVMDYDYVWPSGADTPTDDSLAAGTYTVSVTDTNGCINEYEIEVTQPLAALSLDFENIRNPSCGGYTDGTATANVEGGTSAYGFSWSNGSTTATVSDFAAGTHTVTVTDANDCITIDSITLDEPSAISYTFSTEGVVCYGDDTGILMIENVSGGGGAGVYSYSIDGENYSSSPSFVRLFAGTYEFYIKDDQNCIATQSFTIDGPDELIVDAGEDVQLEYGDSTIFEPTINMAGTYTYEWTTFSPPGTLDCTDCANPTVNTLYNATYTLQITNSDGCTASDDIRIYVNKVQRVYIPNAFTPNGDSKNDVFMVHGGKGALSANIKIYDRSGTLIYQMNNAELNNAEFGWDGTHNGTENEAGVYVYYVEVNFNTGERLPYNGQFTLIR